MLFYNGYKKQELPDFHYVNSSIKRARLPNKILNLALKFNLNSLENLFGEFDWLFMPNLNQFSIGSNTKLALTVHDLSPIVTPEFYDAKRRIWHKFLNYKVAFERANVLFAVSEHTKNDLIKIFNINPDKIKVVYPAVDHNAFNSNISEGELRQVRHIYGLPGEFILFLNTIEPRKNLAGLIKAFEKINSPAYLVIAGRLGWKYNNDFKLIKNSKKSAKIKYIGYVEEKYKPSLIKLAKTLVYPSFYEGFGFQALEAMAVGTPVVASQLTSLPEVTGSAGLLINPYDIGSIVEALNESVNNRSLRENLIQKGLEKAKNFNWDKTAELVISNLK
jgi:glycosyltransferase involved in cell wall biosynthesis